ncbi:TldD/PmbA family protein [Candidatus Thorarchaeota archaeon]|nr:MAG: TldD/PmbA family protein [Candidatus Thorarchaeota archaeon]
MWIMATLIQQRARSCSNRFMGNSLRMVNEQILFVMLRLLVRFWISYPRLMPSVAISSMTQGVVEHKVRWLGSCRGVRIFDSSKFQSEVSSLKQELIELGHYVIKHAEKLGATQVEAYFESTRTLEVKIEKGLIRLAAEKLDSGCGMRVAIGNQLGVSYVTSILEKDLEQSAQDAVKAAQASVADSDFKSFTSTQTPYPTVKGLFDKELDQLSCEQAFEILTRAVESSKEVSGTERNLIEGGFTAESKTIVIVNSEGITGNSSTTKVKLDISSTISTGEDKCSSWEIQNSRVLAEIDPEKIGATSAQNALALRGAKSMECGEMPLILTPRALWEVLGTGFAEALNAREVQDGKSYFTDSLGSPIASSELEIADNGILSGALGSRPFDAEGFPSQNTMLVKSGILHSYLHDSFTSTRDEVECTGNATRSSYRSIPTIGASNLVVTPGTCTLEEMISEVDKGVLCTFTFDRPNSVTGELSAMIMEGFLISQGEVQHALKNTLFGITMQDLLKKTIQVGSDVENRENIQTPSILIESAKITSGQ